MVFVFFYCKVVKLEAMLLQLIYQKRLHAAVQAT